MLIPLSILPIYLFLVQGVTSEDVTNVKKVPQHHFTRKYVYNHPPVHYDKIPVAVVYDNQEVTHENIRKSDLTTADENKNLNKGKSVIFDTPNVNHPPSHSLHPFAGVDDFKEEKNLKPRARSIKLPVDKADETLTPAVSETQAGTTPRRRGHRVKKIKVNKNPLNVHVNEEIPKESAITSAQITSTKPSQVVSRTFSPRTEPRDPVVPIIESENYVFSHSGNFHYSYEGGDGTRAFERGELIQTEDGAGSAVEGTFSYTDKDGNDFSLSYTADENGYRPVGDHLPTPPPTPIYILRALEYLATATPEPSTEKPHFNKKRRN